MGLKSQWIGSEFGAFERVCLAFEAVGYERPHADGTATGGYAANIVAQYVNELSEQEALDVLAFGLMESAAFLRNNRGELSIHDVTGSAQNYLQERSERALASGERKRKKARRPYEEKLSQYSRDTAITQGGY